MTLVQPGILEPIAKLARYLSFEIVDTSATRNALARFAETVDPAVSVTGIGPATVLALNSEVPGLRYLEPLSGPGIEVPSTSAALWCWLRGDDRGELLHCGHALEAALTPGLA